MAKKSLSQKVAEDDRRAPVVSTRARLTQRQSEGLVRCYAERRAPKAAADDTGLSLNSVYKHYGLIRGRLIACGYYTDGALSADEPSLGPEIRQQLRERRGIRAEDIYPHAAELIVWAEEWPPRLVLKHLHRIIALTGPLDAPWPLSSAELNRVFAYARYARTELIHYRTKTLATEDDSWQSFLERTQAEMERYRRAYRTASKKAEREQR